MPRVLDPFRFVLFGSHRVDEPTPTADLAWEQVKRKSGRTGQVHPIGGFTGGGIRGTVGGTPPLAARRPVGRRGPPDGLGQRRRAGAVRGYTISEVRSQDAWFERAEV
jgi:hypothetical protein